MDKLVYFRQLRHELEDAAARLDELRSRAAGRTVAMYGGKASKGASSERALEARAIAVADAEADYRNLLDEMIDLRISLDTVLEPLEPDLREMLKLRYISGCTVEEVVRTMGYKSTRTVYKLYHEYFDRKEIDYENKGNRSRTGKNAPTADSPQKRGRRP